LEQVAPVGIRIRLPGPGAPRAVATLAAANQRARADAIDLIDRVFPSVAFGRLAQQTDDATFAASSAPTDLSGWLDPVALLDRVLTTHDLAEGRMKLMQEGSDSGASTALSQLRDSTPLALAPAGRLAAAFDRGNTVVIDAIDRRDRSLARLAEAVGRTFGCPVNINGYVSYRPKQAFGTHWDSHEVFILQLLGRKRWSLHQPFALSPHQHLHDQHANGEEIWRGELEPGSYLAIPRGWAHTVESLNELSFHLTVTTPRLTVVDLVRWAVRRSDRAPADALLYPPHEGPTDEFVDALADHLGRAVAPERIELAAATARANLASHPTQSLRQLLGALEGRTPPERLWFRSPHPGGVHWAATADGTGHLAFDKRTVTCPDEVLELVAPLLDGRCHRVADIAERTADPAATVELVRQGLRSGLLEVVDPTTWGVVVAD
jgi:hypothetical protein